MTPTLRLSPHHNIMIQQSTAQLLQYYNDESLRLKIAEVWWWIISGYCTGHRLEEINSDWAITVPSIAASSGTHGFTPVLLRH